MRLRPSDLECDLCFNGSPNAAIMPDEGVTDDKVHPLRAV